VNRSNHEQTTPPEPLTGLQAEGGSGRRQGRPYHRPQLAEHFDVHPNQITTWKSQLEASASEIFGLGGGTPATPAVDVRSLHAKIGELTLENDFLEGALTKAGLLSAKR
jgi:transposase